MFTNKALARIGRGSRGGGEFFGVVEGVSGIIREGREITGGDRIKRRFCVDNDVGFIGTIGDAEEDGKVIFLVGDAGGVATRELIYEVAAVVGESIIGGGKGNGAKDGIPPNVGIRIGDALVIFAFKEGATEIDGAAIVGEAEGVSDFVGDLCGEFLA